MNITLPAWMLLGMSAVTLLLAVAATFVGWRGRRKVERYEQYTDELHGPEKYLTRAGYLMSGLFVFIIIVETIPTFYFLQTC
jgi:membrane protein YdbS with pleckstrin-like domain